MKTHLVFILMACIIGLPQLGCKDSTESSDGPEATATATDREKQRQFDVVVAALEADLVILNGIETTDDTTTALTMVQAEALARFRGLWDQARTYQPDTTIDADIFQKARVEAGVDIDGVQAWIEGQSDPKNAFFLARTLMLVLKAYAEAADLPFPYEIRPAGSSPNMEQREDGLSVLRQAAGPCVVVVVVKGPAVVAGAGKAIGVAAGAVATGVGLLIAATERIEYWDCMNWDVKLFSRKCCGKICAYGRGFIHNDTDCTIGDKMVSEDYDDLEPEDCGDDIVHPPEPDMGTPEPDMGTPEPDMGVNEVDGGQAQMGSDPQERE